MQLCTYCMHPVVKYMTSKLVVRDMYASFNSDVQLKTIMSVCLCVWEGVCECVCTGVCVSVCAYVCGSGMYTCMSVCVGGYV